MILKRNFNEHSKEIVNWINGANDAISKKKKVDLSLIDISNIISKY